MYLLPSYQVVISPTGQEGVLACAKKGLPLRHVLLESFSEPQLG